MELTAYNINGATTEIRPAPVQRDWMENTVARFAYRCLPLNIANAHGWEILCPAAFKASWNGKPETNAVTVYAEPGAPSPAMGHFGHGVLTFSIPFLFRTAPGYDLFVQGPVNRPKDAIAPLSGVIETDWAPYTFTMNWMFTRPATVVSFAKGEPICHFFPVRRGELEDYKPRIRALADAPELERQHKEWERSRASFISDLHKPGSEAREEKWQRLYYQGLDASGNEVSDVDHRTRLRLKAFKRG
jgi:hypothetical protein